MMPLTSVLVKSGNRTPPVRAVACYIGVDPGASGGLAVLEVDLVTDELTCKHFPMPDTERDIWDMVRQWGDVQIKSPHYRHSVWAVIEKVHSMPKQGVVSTFKFGVSYGGLRMALVAAGIPFDEIAPRDWQKALGIPPRGKEETKVQFKNRLKAKAQCLFPGEKITLATADALLLADYARRVRCTNMKGRQ